MKGDRFPHSQYVTLNTTQWLKARAMWLDKKDTYAIAEHFGVHESQIYNGIQLLKSKGGK